MDENKSVAAIEQLGGALAALPTPEQAVALAVRKRDILQAVKAAVLKAGVHYGRIPGVDRDTLLKPGAEALASAFGLAKADERIDVIDCGNGHREYRATVSLADSHGRIIAVASGSCSTLESKYRYRWVGQNQLPSTVDPSTLPQRAGRYGPMYRLDNTDPADQYNTCLKMSSKRAFVAAVITATGGSDTFTQDVEDTSIEPAGAAMGSGAATQPAGVAMGSGAASQSSPRQTPPSKQRVKLQPATGTSDAPDYDVLTAASSHR